MRSDLSYERFAQGEVDLPLTPAEQAHVEALKADDREFLSKHPPESVPRPRRDVLWSSLAAVAAALLIAVALPVGDQTRVKSADMSLLIYHKTATGTELLRDQSRLASRDEVQLAYFSAHRHFGAIFSIDGRGTVTTHLPLTGASAAEVETTKPQLLPYSYRLDDAPDFETFYFIAGDQSFKLADIQPFLKGRDARAPLRLPDGFAFVEFRINKQETSE